MDDSKYCTVRFKYLYDNEKDEDVRVVGNLENLGNWDTSKAIKLSLNPKQMGIWKTRLKIKVPISFAFEYKYLIFKNNTFLRWEVIPNNRNRTVQLQEKNAFVLLDKPNDIRTQIKKEITDKKKGDKILKKKKVKKKNDNNKEIMKELDLEKNDLQDLNYDSASEDKKEASKKSIENLSLKKVDISDDDEILMCSFYLPLNVEKDENGKFNFISTNDALYHTLYRIIKDKKNIKWFGLLKNENNFSNSEREQIKVLLEEKNMYLLDIDKDLYNNLIELIGEVIDPMIHYVSPDPSIKKDFTRYITLWNAYKEYNDLVCKTLFEYLNKKTIIYLHDYQFYLVPNKLYSMAKHNKDLLQNLAIGLFIHSPFPSFDVF